MMVVEELFLGIFRVVTESNMVLTVLYHEKGLTLCITRLGSNMGPHLNYDQIEDAISFYDAVSPSYAAALKLIAEKVYS